MLKEANMLQQSNLLLKQVNSYRKISNRNQNYETIMILIQNIYIKKWLDIKIDIFYVNIIKRIQK